MNSVISDTAEYGCYLFDHACKPLLADFMSKVETDIIGKNFNEVKDNVPLRVLILTWQLSKNFNEVKDNGVDNRASNAMNKALRTHSTEIAGDRLRAAMGAMQAIATVG